MMSYCVFVCIQSTVNMPNYDTATVQLASGENPVYLDGGGLTGSRNAPIPSDNNQMISVNTSNSLAFLSGTTNPPLPSTTGRDPAQTRTHPIRSVSEVCFLLVCLTRCFIVSPKNIK